MNNDLEVLILEKDKFSCYKEKLNLLFKENYFTNGGMLYSDDFLTKSDYIIIGKIRNEIVAYMAISYLTEEELDRKYDKYQEEPILDNSVLIKHLVVKKEYRGNGIAKRLFSFLYSYCVNNKIEYMYVWITPDNYKALNLYKSQGFYKMGDFYPDDYTFHGIKDFHSIMLVHKLNEEDKVIITLNKKIENVIKNSGEEVSIIVKRIDNKKEIYKYNSEKKIISASVIKVPIMLAVFEEIKKGNVKLDTNILVKKEDILYDTNIFKNKDQYYSLEELISWMITYSNNTATNVIIKTFGINKINEYIKNILKLKSTHLERYMLDYKAIENGLNNFTSQEDMLNIFEKLFHKEILTEELCIKAIEILYDQHIKDQIMKYIDKEVKYAHKTGSLDFLNHDVGVMNINGKLFYIGVSVLRSKYKEGNKELVANLGKLIYEYLNKL